MAAATGCRLGELLDLGWSDVNLETGVMIVQSGKTASARRRLDLPRWMLSRLVRRRRRTLTNPDPRVFASPSTGAGRWVQSNVSSRLRALFDDACLPWASAHSLRRTAASLLDDAGAGISEIAAVLGHADPSMTSSVYLDRELSRSKAHLAVHL
jgi:integrase